MSVIGMSGFGGRTVDADRITQVNGTILWDTSNVPNAGTAVALRATFNSECYIPFDSSASEFWVHYHVRPSTNNTTNDTLVLGWGNAGSLLGAISFEDSTLRVTIQINGSVVATSTTFSPSVANWVSLHAKVVLDAVTGSVDVYASGDLTTPVVSFSGNTDPTAATNANEFHFDIRANDRIANLIAMDPTDATGITDPQQLISPSIRVLVPTADGNYTDWSPSTGATGYNLIDELPPSDSDYVEATAVSQASTFTHTSVGTVGNVTAVRHSVRVLRTGTGAGSQITIRRRAASTDYDETAVAAPGAGFVSTLWDQKPGGGNWSATDLDATEFGFVSTT